MNEYPSDWEITNLGNLATIKASNVDKKTKQGQKEISLCNYMDVFKNPVVSSTLAFMRSTASEKEISEFSLSKGDVLLTKDSEVPEEIGIPSVVTEDIPNLVCGYHLYMLRADRSRINPEYLCWALRSNSSRQYFYQMANGSTRFGLNLKHVEECPIAVPPLPEQKKIAEILSGIDTLIANKERQVRTLTTLEKSVLDALTEDQTNSGTPCPELSEVVSHDRKITYGIVQAGPHTPNGVPYIRVTDMARDELEPNEMMRTTQEVANKFSRSEVREGDVVVALRGIIGASHLIGKRTAGCNLTQGTALLSKSDKCDPSYMNAILKSGYCRKQFALLSKGSTIIEITLSALATLSIPLPSKAEQERIVRIIDSIQCQIRHGKELLASYKNLKIAISADLLSGRKRVSV